MFKWATAFNKNEFECDIFSPNRNVRCHLALDKGQANYSVYKNDKIIIKPSNLGFLICGEKPFTSLKLVRKISKTHAETFELPWGEDRFIDNNYSETVFFFAEQKTPQRIFTLRFRIFDDGVAFRYEIPPQLKFSQITIQDELTEFNLMVMEP